MHLADLLCALDVLISYYDDLTTRWETCFFPICCFVSFGCCLSLRDMIRLQINVVRAKRIPLVYFLGDEKRM